MRREGLLGRMRRRPAAGAAQAPAGEAPPVESAIATLAALSPSELARHGVQLQRVDYYSALNDLAFLEHNRDLWQGRGLPRSIRWRLDDQLELLSVLGSHLHELSDVPDRAPDPLDFHWENDFWRGTDAMVHYGLVRHLQPQRYVEIGCGWSSLLLARALAENERATGVSCSVHQIEPYPRAELMRALPSQWTREETILQRASLAPVEALRDGDVLFYDGSHVAKAASDVNWFFFEVLPRLAAGVHVHVHDIFWPADYPESWIFDRGQTWNEQYVLQAFLMFNDEFEILLANAALVAARRERVLEMLGALREPVSGGGSVWLRRRTAPQTVP